MASAACQWQATPDSKHSKHEAEQNHWSTRGRATSVGESDALDRPRRSVLAFAILILKTPLQWIAPWEPIDPSMAAKFEDEYATEIAKGHPLYGVPVRAIARRVDRDDVLFQLLRHLCDYVVVHLTWSGREEAAPQWPSFELFLDDELMEKCIRPAQRDYEE